MKQKQLHAETDIHHSCTITPVSLFTNNEFSQKMERRQTFLWVTLKIISE
jgi:hypothetical protein